MSNNRTREEWLLQLQSASRKQLKALFRSGTVPEVCEFEGEFQGMVLDQGNWLANAAAAWCIHRRGRWLGKAFQPVTDEQGRGYNIFRTKDGIQRRLRMQFGIHDSDAGRRFTIEYGNDHTGIVGSICDEMKRIAPEVYLGLGTVVLGGRLFPWIYVRVMFAMIGPVQHCIPAAVKSDLVQPMESFQRIAA